MADIAVTLELDDSKYTSKLKAAEAASQKFSATTLTGLNGLTDGAKKFADGVEGINRKFEGLTSILVGAGIFEFTRSLLDSANNLKDMAGATGVNTARLMEMGLAASQAGSSLDGMAAMLSKLELSVNDANQGNLDLRNNFSKLGLSVKDFQSLSPEQVFNKIGTELAKIPDVATRTALAVELLGKEAKKVTWSDFNSALKEVNGTMDEAAAAQIKAAELSEALATQVSLVKNEFVKLIQPIIDVLIPTGDMSEKMDTAAVTAKLLGAALGAFAAVQVVGALKATVGAVTSLAGALGLTIVATEGATAATVGLTTAEMAMLRVQAASAIERAASLRLTVSMASARVAELAGMEASVVVTAELMAARRALFIATGQLAGAEAAAAGATAGLAAAQGAATVTTAAATTGVTALGARLGLLAIGAQAAAVGMLAFYHASLNVGEDEEVAKIHKLQDAINGLTDDQKSAYFALSAADQKRVADLLITQNEANKAASILDRVKNGIDVNAQADARLKRQGATPFAAPTGMTAPGSDKNPALDAARIQAAELRNQAELASRQQEVAQQRIRLQMQYADKSQSERDSALAGFDAQQKFLTDQQRLKDNIAKLDKQIGNAVGANKEPLQVIRNEYQHQLDALKDMSPAVAELRKQELDRAAAAERTAYYTDLNRKATEQMLDIANQIADLTKTDTQKRLDSIDRLIAKEKLAAREKLQAQAGVGNPLSEAAGQESDAKVEKAFEGMKERNAILVAQSREFSTGWQKAYNEYVDNATNAAERASNIFKQATQGMEDMFVNFAKTGKFEWKSFVNDMLVTLLRSQLQQTIGNIFGMAGKQMKGGGGLLGGKIIPGFLASGGPASSNRSYIVGEQGPELFTPDSNGTVTPNSGLGGQNVTYNISAVDARSFQALIAQDPSFIHAVAMAGSRDTARR